MSRYLTMYSLLFLTVLFNLGCSQSFIVNINTIPNGADIKEEISNRSWKSGETVELPYREGGYYNISIKKEGYKDIFESFYTGNYKNHKIVGTYRLKKLHTLVDIHIQPGNAKVFLKCNGYNFRATKIIDIPDDVFEGQDSIKCLLSAYSPGYEKLEKQLRIKKYSNIRLDEILKENRILIEFNTAPPMVDVYEKHLGYIGTTPFVYELSANKMQNISSFRGENSIGNTRLYFKLIKKGYKTVDKSVILNKNKIEKIDVIMQKN